MKRTPLALATVTMLATLPAYAQTKLEPVIVEATAEEIFTPATTTLNLEDLAPAPSSDGGDFLRNITGVDSGRMGGHGLEPVIRGLQQGQINIYNDGAMQHGGCPNRMDTPSSFAPVETYDEVTVVKGYQTVIHGGGAPGGHVKFNRNPQKLGKEQTLRSIFGAGYESASNTRDAYFDIVGGSDLASLRAVGTVKDAHDYKDGKGDKVRSAFNSKSIALDANWQAKDNLSLGAGIEATKVKDAKFAGALMDSPDTESFVYRLSSNYTPEESDSIANIESSAYYSTVDHLMDNYSLRTPPAMHMKTESESDTYGARMAINMYNGAIFGADFTSNQRSAERYSGASSSNVSTLQSQMWPDSKISQVGIFAEKMHLLKGSNMLTTGLRYDYVSAQADAANTTTSGGSSPNTLYSSYYGTTAKDKTEHHIGGLVRLEKQVGMNNNLYASISRSLRTADATERFIAANNGTAANRWIGNPNIKPEKHHQVELGYKTTESKWNAGISTYFNHVNDYIMRDRARGQDGILQSDGATVYHNVDARLFGAELTAQRKLSKHWWLDASAAYTNGENLDTNQPLPQIAPLNTDVTISYKENKWHSGFRMRAATTQTRVDDSTTTGSGRDVGKTSGYATFDLFATYKHSEKLNLDFGVNNLLDKTYANHLNRSNTFDTTEVQVYEPGRTVFFKIRGKF